MMPPYFQEKSLPYKVKKYMDENQHVDIEDMTDYLMRNYSQFRRKSKNAFMKSVEKAYEWELYRQQKCVDSDSDSGSGDEIIDSDGGGPDVIEIDEPTVSSKKKSMNRTLETMYKSPASGASKPSTPVSKLNTKDILVIDSAGTHQNGTDSPAKSSKKKRKDADGPIEDIIKRKKKKLLQPEECSTTFANMAGIETLKDKICDLVANLRWPGVLQPLQKSVLVTGPSGSGKTTFCQALAGTTESRLLRVTASELVGGVSGESEENINEIFGQAASLAPCILLIEKIDVVAPKEGLGKSMERRIVAQLSSRLSALKSKYKDKQLLVVGESSHPENMDWDLRSSFDVEIFIAIPTVEARAQILELLCGPITFSGDIKELAHMTPGYLAGDLKKLIDKALALAWKRKKETLYGEEESADLMQQLKSFMKLFGKMCETEVDSKVPVNMEDVMEAVKHITPVLKREGFPTVPDVTWQDIGGLEDIKKDLREKILEPIQFVKLHEEFGANRPNGILMWGPPGCGKTLLAKAVANEAAINLLPVMGPELLNMYQGESERAVREVFRRARNVAPCVIFFDEFDSLCPLRNKGAESGSKTTVVNTLLTEMNGFTKRDDVYVIAATNRPDILDPAVTRPGRFDTLLYVDVPDHLGRISIFEARTKNRTCPQLADDVDFDEISRLCNNFSGADCDQLVYLASKEAIREVIHGSSVSPSGRVDPTAKRLVAKRHFAAALKKIKPSISVEEQKRYKKLYRRMETSQVQGELGVFSDHPPQPPSSALEQQPAQPMDIAERN